MIVIPMAGASSRFLKNGYTHPKYQLPLWGRTLFEWSVLSFQNYFNSEKFLFIIRKNPQTVEFVKSLLSSLQIKQFAIQEINLTEGQADTVYQGLKENQTNLEERLIVFNIDTLRPGFTLPLLAQQCDGYLEVFKGEGENWSFVLPQPNSTDSEVMKTSEKRRISNLCSTGLYFFKHSKLFLQAYEASKTHSLQNLEGNERYLAPLYNFLINKNFSIKYHLISNKELISCGVPEEYEALQLQNFPPPLYST